jgi:hypothetical protein
VNKEACGDDHSSIHHLHKVRKGEHRNDGDREMTYLIKCSREVAVALKMLSNWWKCAPISLAVKQLGMAETLTEVTEVQVQSS